MNRRIDFPRCPVTPLQSIIPTASSEAIDLILKMLQWDPHKRPTATQCLQHPFFTQDVRSEYQRKLSVSTSQDREDQRRMSPSKGAGFMNLRNSQNKSLQQKSASMLSPLNNNASMGDISGANRQDLGMNNAYIPKMPGLPPTSNNANSYEMGGGAKEAPSSGAFTTGKGSVIKRDSIVFKPPGFEASGGGSSSNYRNNQAGI